MGEKHYVGTTFVEEEKPEHTKFNTLNSRIASSVEMTGAALSLLCGDDKVIDDTTSSTELKVVESGVPDMNVMVNSGYAIVSGALVRNASAVGKSVSVPTSSNRYTIIQIDNEGNITTKNSAEAGSPVEPDPDTDNIKLAAIYLPQNCTHINDTDQGQGYIIDRRDFSGGAKYVEIHPEYPGKVTTNSLRGAAASGNNTVTESVSEDVVSNVSRHYYENTSGEATLQGSYIAIRFTLPDDFDSWATSDAILIDFRTESSTYLNSHVDVYLYKSGTAAQVTNDENNASTSWAIITLDDSALGSWSAGDVVEIYVGLETRNNYYSRVGRIRFNYMA